MAYLKPPWFARAVFNKVAMATGMSNTEKLTVMRRRSKQRQEVPVITVDVSGTKYLVSTRGESQWVKNVRADPNVELNAAPYVAAETPVETRQPILDAYKVKAGKVVEGYFRELPDPADHPVFTLTP